MSTSVVETEPRATHVVVSDDELTVHLVDGRKVSVPLVWYPRLFNASPEQRREWELIGDGEGIHWPQADEDLSVAGILRGTRAPRVGRVA
ncbi:MAG TPA: DUF2442 domain-containing protein [Thermoanaerobaculia bacterium]